jgi:TolB-like protein/class 3 adenylate cyclase/cytochrome c-type biogenesis protein CcmH/NrfG
MPSEHRSNLPTPPSGTVTFLFTDIEGSTRLWATHHDAMRASLARHDALLRQSIEAHGGHVFKTGGDAFCAAFATAASAVEAAVAAQRALRAERWPEQAAIHARIALHTGAAEIRDGDYFGPPLNQVARLLAVGHGGQTLVSEITHDLCRDRLPAETTLKSLGEHSLKDLARRETVFQLCHPDLPQAFPPLRTLLAPIDENLPSIAVLPFTDLSPEKDQEYFTDGLAEELLNVLSKIRSLRVASRTSAFHFKGKDVDIPTIAQKLNVATILEGSVRKVGKRVRITAQLIQVATDSHLWSETYDRELEDIFAVQDDIAQSVVKELRIALLGDTRDAAASAEVKAEVEGAAKGRGDNAEAYRLYLQGRFFMDRSTREDMAKGIEYFRQALQQDPGYALVWAALAQAYLYQASYSWAPMAKAGGPAREAARRALELGPDLAESHAAVAYVRMYYDWDWKGADSAIRRALELAPRDPFLIRQLSVLAQILGRSDEAIHLARQAMALDPLSVIGYIAIGRWNLSADRLEDAEAAFNTALELNPQREAIYFFIGLTRLAQGRLDDALAAFEQETHPVQVVGLTLVHFAQGRRLESDAALRELLDKGAEGFAWHIAVAYAYRGKVDRAFDWLNRAYAQHDLLLVSVKKDRWLRNLHADPRWQPFLEKMGLADGASA